MSARLFSGSDIRNKARLLSLSLPHSGDWVDATPTPYLNTHMDSRVFEKASCYRLGLKVMPETPCDGDACARSVDSLGDHAMHCRNDHGIRGGRHDRVRDVIFHEAQVGAFNPTKEMPGLIPGSQSRPADVYIEDWVDGSKCCFDISVISPTQEGIIDRACGTAGSALEMRKTSKNRNHFDNCRASGKLFLPLVVETFGGLDLGATKILKKITNRAASRKNTAYTVEVKYFLPEAFRCTATRQCNFTT